MDILMFIFKFSFISGVVILLLSIFLMGLEKLLDVFFKIVFTVVGYLFK